MKTKKCSKCGKQKSLYEFYRHPYTKDGWANKCIQCRRSPIGRDPLPEKVFRERGGIRYMRVEQVRRLNMPKEEYERLPKVYAVCVLWNKEGEPAYRWEFFPTIYDARWFIWEWAKEGRAQQVDILKISNFEEKEGSVTFKVLRVLDESLTLLMRKIFEEYNLEVPSQKEGEIVKTKREWLLFPPEKVQDTLPGGEAS